AGLDRIELLPKDTLGTPGGAANAADEALADGASLLLGPLFGSSVGAVASRAQAAQVPVIAFSNDRSVRGRGIYLLGVTPDEQIARILSFAVSQGVFRVTALVPQNAYGNAVATALYGAAAQTYADVIGVEYYVPGTPDHSATVEKMVVDPATGETPEELSFDAVLIAAGGAELSAIAPLFPYYDADTTRVRLLGTSQWQREETLAEPALRGGWFSAPPTERWLAFENRYRTLFGAPPPEPAALAYDAVELAGFLVASSRISTSPTSALRFERPTIDETLLFDPAGFEGLRGAYSFDAEGIARHALAIYRVAAGRFEQIDAPRGAVGPPTF
ncbi:MAG: penicillin-binding protein activator, partial [Alphaproteobacteria bacterium]